jgi:hypothetical protein
MKFDSLTIELPEHINWKFTQKCNFYEVRKQDIIAFLLEKFIDGDYDKELELPID